METRLRHARIEVTLHRLREGEGTPLLLLHALRGSSADWGAGPDWPGPVHALDFSGHGASDWVHGGVYYPELLAADADIALAELHEAVLAGAGLGAYVALLLAGGRSERIPGVVLLPGEGLAGGGAAPRFDGRDRSLDPVAPAPEATTDPHLEFCDQDLRPVDYAVDFAENARRVVLVEDGTPRPPWWEVARGAPGSEAAPDLESALRKLA